MRSRLWFLVTALWLLGACQSGLDLFGGGLGSGGSGGGSGGSGGGDRPPAFAESVDLLLVIDNSRSMRDKQEVLGLGLGDLIRLLVNPLCLDAQGLPITSQPSSPDDACPAGSARPFAPIVDMHIGVITSSLGGHGADACNLNPTENDHGHLITRGPNGSEVITYESLGFLAWDPKQSFEPPGLADTDILETNLQGLVVGAGQQGCGYEATLESWYRFLVDPDPYETIQVRGSAAAMSGTDDFLLRQRKDFLRPNSLLAIVMLSDENDCSMREGGPYYAAAQLLKPGSNEFYHLPRARAACNVDPNADCCRSCGQPPGLGCDDSNDQCSSPLTDLEDNFNVRCFDQKKRFGVDFLYPIERYQEALTLPTVSDRAGQVVPNPIFTDLDHSDDITKVRDERLVFLTAIVGVPWQDIARRTNGIPDLAKGEDTKGNPIGGFQTAAELVAKDTWSLILGDPLHYHTSPTALPDDPLMEESIEPRNGIHPITGEPVAPPGASADANSINGHEYSIPNKDDLQFACIFSLLVPKDCSELGSCDCDLPDGNPQCQDALGAYTTTQLRAKAYPGIRHLELVKALGDQAVLGSICPAQLNIPTTGDYAYLALVRTLVETITPRLVAPK